MKSFFPLPILAGGLCLLLAAGASAAEFQNPFPADGEGKLFRKAFQKTNQTYSPEELAGIFQIEGDEIHVYRGWSHVEAPFATLVTVADYANFELELEFKWGERKFAPRLKDKRDAGVLMFARNPEKVWPPSVECQIQETDVGDLWVIFSRARALVDETTSFDPAGKPHEIGLTKDFEEINRAGATERPGWNAVRVVVKNGAGKFFLNGQLVNAFQSATDKAGQPVTRGAVALQAECAELTYRNVRIRPLDAKE